VRQYGRLSIATAWLLVVVEVALEITGWF